jgi:large subunit ribosomal protein L27
MAHTKAVGSTKLGRDSISKRLGVKCQNGEAVTPGMVIIRQRGTKYIPGKNVVRADDDTLFAKVAGVVEYASKMKTKFDGNRRRATVVSVK